MAANPDIQERVEKYVEEQSQLDVLRFITCGSVDDGKSTLIGRMLFEAQLIFEDQVAALRNDSRKMGTQGGDIDYALLVSLMAFRRNGSRASPSTWRIASSRPIIENSLWPTRPATNSTPGTW